MKCILPALICVICLAACNPAAAVSSAEPSVQAAGISTRSVTPAAAEETPRPVAPLQLIDTSRSCGTPAPTDVPQSEHWQIINRFDAFGDYTLIGFVNPAHGIGVGLHNMLYYSLDNARTWQSAQNTSNCLFGLDIVDEQTAWTCGNIGDVRFSTDGGETWQVAKNFLDHTLAYCHHLSFLDAATGWAATTTDLGLTTDGGRTWNPIPLPQGVGKIDAIFLRTAAEGYILDDVQQLFITTDGGQTWRLLSTLPGYGNMDLVTQWVPTAAIRFRDSENGVAVYQTRDCQTGWHLYFAHTSTGGRDWQVEQLITDPQLAGGINLSRDGQYLTRILTNPHILAKEVTVYRYQP